MIPIRRISRSALLGRLVTPVSKRRSRAFFPCRGCLLAKAAIETALHAGVLPPDNLARSSGRMNQPFDNRLRQQPIARVQPPHKVKQNV